MSVIAPVRAIPFALIIALASSLSAAIVIKGRVVDETGAPVQQARIEAVRAEQSQQNVTRAESDAAGAFILTIESEGAYGLRVEHDGFFQYVNASTNLTPDAELEIRINHVKELAEKLDVRYSPPAIDNEQTADTKTLHSPDIQNVPYPASQDYRSAFQLLPGAIQDNAGQWHFNGGATNEANYRLNGFDISDPASGTLTARMNVDTVQTIEWQASRFSPETGKGSAGTVEIRTQTGDDHWRFGATNFVPGVSFQNGAYLNHWSPRIIVSGPIKKGRAWFHNAFDSYYAASTVSRLPNGQNRTSSITTTDLTRAQWNISDNQILTASFLVNIGDSHRLGLSFLDPAETTVNQHTSLLIGTIKDQFIIGGGLVEFGFAETSGYFRNSPQGNQTYVITPFGASGNFFRADKSWTDRQEWTAHGYVRPLSWHGSHQVEIGTDIERSNLEQTIYRHEFMVVRADNSVVRTVQFEGSPLQFRTNIEVYGYALDRWNPRQDLTIDAGFRTQWDEYTRGAPPAPRVAAAWSPKWLGGTKISGGWGLFYNAITLNMLALSQEQTSLTTFYSPGGLPVGAPVASSYVLTPQALRLPKFSIASITAERRLPWGVYGRANLIVRDGSRGFTFEQAAVNPATNLYILNNARRERYRAAEFSLKRTFLAKYQWFASYTRSDARSNAVLAYSIENPLLSPQEGGPLAWDAPNRIMGWGWAPIEKAWFPHFFQPIVGETDLQVLADYRTGFPFTATNELGFVVGEPNGYRFPDYFTLNVGLERKFPFRGYLFAFRVALINALNRENPNVVNSDADSPHFLEFSPGQARAFNVRLRLIGRK
ncbi:MAG TPA: carboxypeptidase regulatory-like domain-containing protein [Bryobacteraceae bacterium]|nr:carboxypeptidase regulatory-like domain-containing protein [Bryobacteraceae bacterium]